ncbi:MAG: LamG-like jellyroll fold domain-containing protein, partial [Bacteroidota bacterium]
MKLPLLIVLFLSVLINSINAQIPPGSVLWLRADQQVITGAGNRVTNWNDVSGNNNNVSQGNVSNQPELIQNVFGNMPSILFDGVNGKYFLNNTSINLVPAGSPRTIFIVGKMDCAAVANGGGAFPGGGGALFTFRRTAPIFCVESVTVPPNGNFVYTAGLGTFSNETVADDFINTSKFTFVHTYISNGSGTHLQLRQNGQPVIVTPQTPCGPLPSCDPAIADNGSTGFTVGDREDYIGQDWQGYISEIIVYPTALSTADISQVEQYLSNKYFLSTGAPFTGIASIAKDNSTNINIEGDWKHSYNISAPSNVIVSIKDTCNIQGIRIDTVYNEPGNSINAGPYKFMRRHFTVKYSNGPTGIKKVRLYFSDADFSALQAVIPGLTSVSQLAVVRYSGPTENGFFDTTDAIQKQHFSPAELATGSAYNNNYIELNTYSFGEFWIYAIPLNIGCNSWLHIPNSQSYVTVGEIDIPGTQITVEGLFSRDSALTPEGYTSLNIVSKHWTPADVNYLLRVDRAQVTTTNGHFMTPDICELKNKKIYHAAMTYDGATLKFYQNGYLMSQVPCTGSMFQNDYLTTIAATANSPTTNTQLIGFLNEIRIWNVVKTQAELQQYMNGALPNPTTQAGLLGYYTFESLTNKQGNSLYDATLHGNAVINTTITDCNFVADSCVPVVTSTCNNWLFTPSHPSYADFGEIDIPGNTITVEATFYRTGNPTVEGDLVSKYEDPNDEVNYLLRPNHAYITTDDGFFLTPDICAAELNKRYHVAMVYDGSTLKFYRNGLLMSQVNATGSLSQNSFPTRVGLSSLISPADRNFIGYINEVRIWNTVRTQPEIQSYMNATLPPPATQTGLVGYYTFDDLINKQGNAAFNGTISSNASLNSVVPDCSFIADSCITITSGGGIINDYAAITTIDICNNTATVDDPSKFNTGDTVVIMQMKGAAIDSSNTISFGTITNYNNAGKYEFNYVKSKTGNTIEFENTFLNNYDAAFGRVQLIRVPYFQSFTVNNNLTCSAWDGTKGGVLILNSATTVTLNDTIDVSYKGFRGGAVGGGFSCGNVSDWSAPTGTGGTKGEGITEYIPGFEAGGARLASGGGGAYAANSGGGGGGNWGAGGLGGFHSNTCPTPTQSMEGAAVTSLILEHFVLGGGGGGGQQDNAQPVAPGGNGGGMVIIKAATLNSNDKLILAKGESVTTTVKDEGGAGGGAGGTILLFVNNYTDTLYAQLNGGDGSSNFNDIYPTRCHGPGGGGGGGLFAISTNGVTPPALNYITTEGGKAGLVLNPMSACAGTSNGATSGASGAAGFNIVLPEATIPFKKNIDSVRFNETLVACKTFNFNGIAFTNTSAIQKWEWNFGDGATGTDQSTSHTYVNYAPHTVKLIATDINGCKDSISKIITTNGINFDFVFEQDVCNPLGVRFKAVGDTTAEIFWSLGDGTIINNIRNPLHVYPDTGFYLVQYSTGNISTGCIDTVRKTIFIGWRNANIILTPDTTICYGANKLLRSHIDSTFKFCWSPAGFLNNVNLADPTTNTASTITYQLLGVGEENNLVTNGNFNVGSTGFSSDYTVGTTPLSSAEYVVATSTLNAGPSAATCNDHTTGTGNMLVVRNDFSVDTEVWGQTVNISPNTTYTFSAWFQSLFTTSNVQLQLSINGNIVADSIALSNTTCAWQKNSVIWNSGNNTTAVVAIMNKANTSGSDDYFAIDDINLSLYSIKKDTVRISVDTPFINTRADTSICESISVTLNTSSAVTYSWTPAAGLSSTSAANPIATPTDTTKYFVTGTNAFGCQAIDSVTIAVKPKPSISMTGDTLVCRNTAVPLFALGGVSYVWSPAASLNNTVSPTPIANPVSDTWYYVAVTGANNCITTDSVKVTVKPIPVFAVSADKSVCFGNKPQLTASGGNFYLWSPASLVNNPNISDPLAVTNNTTLYSVLIRDTTCGDVTTLTTNVIILPTPTVTAAKENDINCAIGSTVLRAEGALQYTWAPASSLNNATSATPIASPVNNTTFTVTGTDTNGCSNTASVTVLTDYSARVSYTMPNAFTPNGDGHNDCFRTKYFGLIQELQFVIYNRWGEKVFFTTNPNDCWDGTYKGNP